MKMINLEILTKISFLTVKIVNSKIILILMKKSRNTEIVSLIFLKMVLLINNKNKKIKN
jgi:hypothetical protein